MRQEEQFAALMNELGITYTETVGRLDFFLPDFGLFVELKQFPCDRLQGQLESVMPRPVVVLCGPEYVAAFRSLLLALKAKPHTPEHVG